MSLSKLAVRFSTTLELVHSGVTDCMWLVLSLGFNILNHHLAFEIFKGVLLFISCLHFSPTIHYLIHYNWLRPVILLKLVRLRFSVIPLTATLKATFALYLTRFLGYVCICWWLELWKIHSLGFHHNTHISPCAPQFSFQLPGLFLCTHVLPWWGSPRLLPLSL